MGLRNLSAGQLDKDISSTDTSIDLQSGQGNLMPTTPFYATIAKFGVLSNLSNSEIVKVTSVSGDTLTVSRAERNTTAYSFLKGDILMAGVYIEELNAKIEKVQDDTSPKLGGNLDGNNKDITNVDTAKINSTRSVYIIYIRYILTISVLVATEFVDCKNISNVNDIDASGAVDFSGASSRKGMRPDYSTSEKKVGYKWIDGKDVYEKTVTIHISASKKRQNIRTLVTEVDTMIDTYGFWYHSNTADNHRTINSTYPSSNTPDLTAFAAVYYSEQGTGEIRLTTWSSEKRTSQPATVVCVYTKK